MVSSAGRALVIVAGVALLIAAWVHILSSGGHRSSSHDDDDDDSITVGPTTTTTGATIASLNVAATPFTPSPTSPPPAASLSEGRIRLYTRCNEPEPYHTGSCRAHFTYTSTHGGAVSVAVGPLNYVSLAGQINAGQPDVFSAGSGEASFVWPCASQSFVRWTLHDGVYTTSAGMGAAVVACQE